MELGGSRQHWRPFFPKITYLLQRQCLHFSRLYFSRGGTVYQVIYLCEMPSRRKLRSVVSQRHPVVIPKLNHAM